MADSTVDDTIAMATTAGILAVKTLNPTGYAVGKKFIKAIRAASTWLDDALADDKVSDTELNRGFAELVEQGYGKVAFKLMSDVYRYMRG